MKDLLYAMFDGCLRSWCRHRSGQHFSVVNFAGYLRELSLILELNLNQVILYCPDVEDFFFLYIIKDL